MGHVYVRATVCNALDYAQYLEGRLGYGDVRRVEVEVLVDTGATFPTLPEDAIGRLGLVRVGEYPAETAGGSATVELFGPALIAVEDRVAICPVVRRPRGTTPLIGVVALEQMGFRVDPVTGRLIKGLPLML